FGRTTLLIQFMSLDLGQTRRSAGRFRLYGDCGRYYQSRRGPQTALPLKASLWLSLGAPCARGERTHQVRQRGNRPGRCAAVVEALGDCVAERGADSDAVGVAADARRILGGLDSEAGDDRQAGMRLDALDRLTDSGMAL